MRPGARFRDQLQLCEEAEDLRSPAGHWTGTKADGSPFEERGVLIMGIRDDRIAWGRLYAEEVEPEGADIDAVVGRMAGTDDR